MHLANVLALVHKLVSAVVPLVLVLLGEYARGFVFVCMYACVCNCLSA